MNWSARDRQTVLDMGRVLKQPFPPIYLLIPVETRDSRYDPFTEGAVDPSDASQYRTGDSALSWKALEIKGRVGSPNITDFHYPALAAAGYTDQDLLLYISKADLPNLQQVIDNENAYVYFSGLRYRPFNETQIGVFQHDELFVHLKKQFVKEPASGY